MKRQYQTDDWSLDLAEWLPNYGCVFNDKINNMDAKTIKALKDDIIRWDLICYGIKGFWQDSDDIGGELCTQFQTPDCGDCPISWYKDALWANPWSGCGDTPIGDYLADIYIEMSGYIVESDNIDKACDDAERCVEFLISLLPEKERTKYRLD